MIRSCRDCINFEDRRDIDGYALCGKNRGPVVSCEDFNPKDDFVKETRLYEQFCLECTNLQLVDETPVCAENHNTGIACDEFQDWSEVLQVIQQKKRTKTIWLIHALNSESNLHLPELLVTVARTQKIKL